MIGLQLAAVLLLGAAGWAKLRRPGSARSVLTAARLPGASRWPAGVVNRGAGLVECLAALAAFCVGGRLAAALLALGFGLLALVSARMVQVERGQDCGCFARPTPISHWHTGVNAVAAAVGFAGLVRPSGALLSTAADRPFLTAMTLLGAGLLAYLAYLIMTALPDLLSTVADLEAAR